MGSLPVSVICNKVFLIGSIHHGSPPYRSETVKNSLLITGLGAGKDPVRLNERPHRTIVIWAHIRHPRPEYRGTEFYNRHRL